MMARVKTYRPFGLGQEDMKELVGISVTSKEIERVVCQFEKGVGAFYTKQGFPDDVIPFVYAAKMYIYMDGTGVPVEKMKPMAAKAKAKMVQPRPEKQNLSACLPNVG
jgi:hypothetical protein